MLPEQDHKGEVSRDSSSKPSTKESTSKPSTKESSSKQASKESASKPSKESSSKASKEEGKPSKEASTGPKRALLDEADLLGDETGRDLFGTNLLEDSSLEEGLRMLLNMADDEQPGGRVSLFWKLELLVFINPCCSVC